MEMGRFELAVEYRAAYHADLPHVVKLSGGRTSGYLAMKIGASLSRERGDLMLFNNTSAEHPETYDFLCLLKKRIESDFQIPVFFLQYMSLKNANGFRGASYRLVNERPKSADNPDGYAWRGEVYEELISATGYLPQVMSRSCTHRLKKQPTIDMMTDWLYHRQPCRQGDRTEPSIEEWYASHQRRNGRKSFAKFCQMRSYVRNVSGERPAQRYEEFSSVYQPFRGGEDAFVSLIGLRGDEPHRIARIEKLRRPNHTDPVDEHAYCPLRESTVEDVNDYWRSSSLDLELPYEDNVGNCAYCFLKGQKSLAATLRWQYQNGAEPNTPADLGWWQRIESTYGSPRRDGNGSVGFFREPLSYDNLEDVIMKRTPGQRTLWENNMPCDCTG